MAAAMLVDIMRQPEVLAGLLARRDEFRAIGARHLSGRPRILFGCGDGWFAARAVAGAAPSVKAATSLEVASRPLDALGGHAGVAISMSGTVDRTNEAAGRLAQAGAGCVALSNEDGGPLGPIAGAVASLRVPDVAAFLTGTTRYSATLLGLLLMLDGSDSTVALPEPALAGWIGRDLARALAEADAALPAICARIVEAGLSGVRSLGAGADWASADYGAAKLVKVIEAPVWSAEIEEFAHSQFWAARRDELVVLLAGSEAAARLAQNTAEALAEAGMRTLAIESAGVAVPAATWRLAVPPVPSVLAPLALSVPLQLLAYHLARACGGDPDASQDRAAPERFRAAQLLSRRCELAA